MTSISVPRPGVSAEAQQALSATRVAVLLGVTIFLALLAYYFIGVDEGMTSVFGKTMVRPRVGARLAALPRLPLPLIRGHLWKSASSGAEPSPV